MYLILFISLYLGNTTLSRNNYNNEYKENSSIYYSLVYSRMYNCW